MKTPANSSFEGTISVQLANDQTLDQFCADHISEYHEDRYEAVSIRIMVGAEIVITVYAIDKMHVHGGAEEKIPVKKFKLALLQLGDLLSYCGGFRLSLVKPDFNLSNMEVINK